MEGGFEEGVPAEFLGQCDGDGPAADDVALLAVFGVAAAVWASDRFPACNAALVSGWDSTAAAVSNAVLAEPAVDPEARAIQSDTSAKPRSLCAPHAPARAAA